MKYSRTALGLLNAQYRSVLRKCFLINAGLFALGAIAATPANAEDYTSRQVVNGETATYNSNDTFKNITVDAAGAAIYVENNGTINVNGTLFEGNRSGPTDLTNPNYEGGAIRALESNLNINGATFDGNMSGRGGAISVRNGTTNISGSTFENNVGGKMASTINLGSSGGASSVSLNLTDNTFENNGNDYKPLSVISINASQAPNASVKLSGNTFKNNTGQEGVFNVQTGNADGYTKIVFEDENTFENNSGTGVFLYSNTEATFKNGSNTIFSGNDTTNASQSKNGGAIYNDATVTFEDGSQVTFTGNKAKNGGAIFNKGTMTLADGATFLNNDLTGNGDGADIYNNGGSITIGDNLTVTHEGEMTADCNIYSDNGGFITIGDNATFNGGGDAIVTSGSVDSRATLIIGDGSKFSNFDDAAIIAWNDTDATIGKNATFDKTGLAIQNSRNSATTVDDGFVVQNAGNENWGAILNRAKDGGDGTTTLEFLGKATIKDNTNVGLYNRLGAITTFDGATTFSGNTASGNGAAIRNVDGTDDYKSTVTFNDEVTFNQNTSQGTGGAIYNAANGVVNFNDSATFSGNTDTNGSNDIYNAGTINFGGTADLAGGIDGAAGTVNVSGDVKVANALKNQTVNVNAGELALNAANVSGSTINLASDAVLNTINNAIDDYSSIQLADNSNIKVDANLGLGQMDLFSAKYGHDTVDLNVVEANMIGTSDEEVLMQLVNNGVKVNTSSVIYEWDEDAQKHTKTGIVGSGSADGKVKVSNGATASNLEVAAADTQASVKESVVYEMGENEDFGSATVENAQFIVEGNDKSVNVSGSFGIDGQSVVTINDATFNGTGSIDSKGKLRINDSYINVNVNLTDHAILESDPTEYSAKVSVDSTSTATFDEDTFTSTAELANAGTANLSNVTFEDGSKITGNGGTGALNFTNGTTTLGATVEDNTLNIQNGASVVLTESGDIDGLALANDANGGTIDLRNNKIDTLGSTALSSTLNVLMDIDLNADTSDNLGTISGTGGLNLTALELLKLGSDTENIQIATAGTNITLSSNAENTLKTYYSTVSYDSGTGILSLSGKNPSASADLVGTWGSGNYIKAYNASDSANTSVGANLGYLDTQVKANEDAIAQNASDIADINTAITVTADGNYISAGTEVANNLTALDTAVSGKQNALTAGSGIDITSDTISIKSNSITHDMIKEAEVYKSNLSLGVQNEINQGVSADTRVGKQTTAYSGGALDGKTIGAGDTSTDITVVSALGTLNGAIADKTLTVDTTTGIATIKDGTTTANVYTKEAAEAIFTEKQKWVDDTLGIVSANSDAVKEQYASTNYLKEATTLTGADKALDSALKANADIDATQSATMNTLAGIVNGGSVAADGTYTAGEALTAYKSKSTLTGVVNALETNKQENLVINANSGLKWNDAEQTQLAVKLADTTTSKSGLQLSDDGLSIKTGDTMQITNEGYLNIKYDTNTFTTDDTVGLKIANKGIKTAMLDDGAVTFDKLASSVYSTTVGTGSDTVLATTSAVKAYSDSAIAEAITFNSDNTVTLTVGSNSADIYDTTGTANYVKANAQNADYTATSGAVDLTSNSSIAQALQTLDSAKASLAKDNTFTGANTFKSDSGITVQNKTTPAISSNLVATQLTVGTEAHDVLQLTVSDSTGKGSALYVKDADVVTNGGFMALDASGTDRFSADEDGIELKKASGATTFSVDSATGNTAVAGTMDIEGDTTIGDKFSVTAADGSISATGGLFTVHDNGYVDAAGGKFKVGQGGSISATKGLFTVHDNGYVDAAGGKFQVAEGGSISASNGNFTVDADGNVTAAGTMDIEGDTTIGGTLDVTGLASLDGGINVNEKFSVDTNGNTTVLGNLGVSGASFLKDTTVDGGLGVTGNATVAQNLGVGGTAFLNAASVTNDLGVGGNATVAKNFSVGGTSFLKDTTVDGGLGVTGNATVVGTAKVGALTFNGTDKVNAIDTGAAAITDGDATTTARKETMATTATVAKTIGNLAKLENTHGVTSVADVASAINSLATNVETATGGTFTNNVWKGTVTMAAKPDYTYNGATGHANIMAFVNDLASNIGAATTAANGNITSSKTVNANLDQLDGAIGNRSNLGSKNDAINTGTKTSVAAGLKAAGDAIGDMNFGQSHYVSAQNDLSGAVRTLDSNLYRVETDLRDLKRDFNRGMASMAAMSALVPNPRAHGNTSLAIGTGAYSGHTAAAIGGFHYLTDNIMLNAGVAWGNSSDASYRMGVTFSW